MAASIFGRIGAIKGESKDAKHRDEIEVLSWSWGVSHSGTSTRGSGSGAGKATFQDFTFTHHIDKASPALLRACATGQHLKDATITVRKAGRGQQEYLVITMTDVLVMSVSMSVSAEADANVESVTLEFARVDYAYKPQKADGSLEAPVQFKYDLKTNKVG